MFLGSPDSLNVILGVQGKRAVLSLSMSCVPGSGVFSERKSSLNVGISLCMGIL